MVRGRPRGRGFCGVAGRDSRSVTDVWPEPRDRDRDRQIRTLVLRDTVRVRVPEFIFGCTTIEWCRVLSLGHTLKLFGKTFGPRPRAEEEDGI